MSRATTRRWCMVRISPLSNSTSSSPFVKTCWIVAGHSSTTADPSGVSGPRDDEDDEDDEEDEEDEGGDHGALTRWPTSAWFGCTCAELIEVSSAMPRIDDTLTPPRAPPRPWPWPWPRRRRPPLPLPLPWLWPLAWLDRRRADWASLLEPGEARSRWEGEAVGEWDAAEYGDSVVCWGRAGGEPGERRLRAGEYEATEYDVADNAEAWVDSAPGEYEAAEAAEAESPPPMRPSRLRSVPSRSLRIIETN